MIDKFSCTSHNNACVVCYVLPEKKIRTDPVVYQEAWRPLGTWKLALPRSCTRRNWTLWSLLRFSDRSAYGPGKICVICSAN